MSCRICLEEEGPFVHPCMCKGSTGDVHAKCLQHWIDESKNNTCEICHYEYQKSDVLAWNPKRCCDQFWNCNMSSENNNLFRRLGWSIFSASCFVLIFVEEPSMVLASCISTLLISFLVFFYSIETHGHDTGLYNAVLAWKLAFTIPYTISILLIFLEYEQRCDAACLSLRQMCNADCPVFDSFETRVDFVWDLWIYDLSMLVFIIALRSIMVGYFHMRSLKFHSVLGITTPEAAPLLSA
mgnify:CR=1 FL=1